MGGAWGCRRRLGRQSAFWLHLLRCFPAAEQLSPATSHQPSALKGQAPQFGFAFPTGGSLQGRGRGWGCLAVPSLSLISKLVRLPRVCSATWIGETGVLHFFFYLSILAAEGKAENDKNVFLQSHFFFLSRRR